MARIADAEFPTGCRPVTIRDNYPVGNPGAYATANINGCTISLRSDWETWTRPYLCAILTHEYGHLAGYGHSEDPGSIMHPDVPYTAWPSACIAVQELEARERRLVERLEDASCKTARKIKTKLARLRERIGV